MHHGVINQNWFDNPIDCDCIKGQDTYEQGDALVEVLDEKFYKVIKARGVDPAFFLGKIQILLIKQKSFFIYLNYLCNS